MKKVLSTKLLDPETVAHAQSLNLEVRSSDFIATRGLAFDTLALSGQGSDAIVFTSSRAVKYFFEQAGTQQFLKDKKVFSLAGKTKDELQKREIKPALWAANAGGLADAIIGAGAAKSVVHVCGKLKLNVLESKLAHAGIRYTPLFVYETVLKRQEAVKGKFDAVLFFSPSGVESFFSANELSNGVVCCCIGHSTANALSVRKSGARIILPLQPSPVAMINEVAQYFKRQIRPPRPAATPPK